MLIKRVLLVAATAFLAVNIWTGAPLLALWVGSQATGQKALSMSAIFVVVLVLSGLVVAMAFGLAWLDATYKRLTGLPLRERRLAWLRSMNTQDDRAAVVRLSAVERAVMISVYLAVIALLLVFFLVRASPLPS
jgi:hypothetical protein